MVIFYKSDVKKVFIVTGTVPVKTFIFGSKQKVYLNEV